MDFTIEELKVIQKALMYYRTHGCGFNTEVYHVAVSTLEKISTGVYTQTDK